MSLSMSEIFSQEVKSNIEGLRNDKDLQALSRIWLREVSPHKYAYNFSWMGRPIIQFPQDIVAIQELIWKIKPDLIVETGIAHGGSLMMSASMLAILDYCDAVEQGRGIDSLVGNRKVIGVDIEIREHNRVAIEAHPLAHKVEMIEGSSIDPLVIDQVKKIASNYSKVLVLLDSNHTHEHVLAELRAYAPLVSVGSYCVVFDTVIEDMKEDSFPNRPWGRGNNPKTAVHAYLSENLAFEIDSALESKLMITVAPDGYLRKIR